MKATTYNIITLFSLLTLFLVSTSCTDELATATGRTTDNQTPRFVVSTNSPQTRVSYGSITQSTFEEGDVLGAFVLDQGGNIVINSSANITYSNIQYQVVGNASDGTQTLEPVLSQDALPYGDGTYRYIFYYPFREGTTYSNVTHTVQTDQTTPHLYELSDLLWDVTTVTPGTDNAPTVEVAMDHAMANIVLNIDRSYLLSSNEGYEVHILNTPYIVSDINLSQSLNNENRSYTVDNEHTTNIRMWCSNNEAQAETLQFRAVIPACQSISLGIPFLQITAADGTQKQFSLKENLTLLSGRNYIFTVTENGEPTPIIPDVTDDDSWVFDVLDPETNEPVGLLCREYLRYQPQHGTTQGADAVTGTPVLNGSKLAINSQAWVFYNLQADGKTPELSKGIVLRFIYDICINNNELAATQAPDIWPLPHTKSSGNSQGLFTPEHGFKWIISPTNAPNGESYGISSSEVPDNQLTEDQKEKNYYMHGGTIIWDNTNDRISDFIPLSEGAPTNSEAKANGHIAINENGIATVNYSAISSTSPHTDIEGNKVGILNPRNLIDTRINNINQLETNLYPLVKIGYNQFWISKSFRATTLRDGTILPCYNQKGNPNGTSLNERKPANVTFPSGSTEYLDKGYIFPFAQNVETDNGEITNYDPYNDPIEMAGPQGKEWDGRPSNYRPAPLYNKPTIENEMFIPLASEDQYEYLMPTVDEFSSMMNYFGYAYAAKLCTREISRTYGDKTNAYAKYTTLMRGETRSSGTYPANISGFNLRPAGYYTNQGGMNGLSAASEGAALILKSQNTVNPNSVAYITFQTYDPWSTNNIPDFFETENTFGGWQHPYTYFFAQVRLFMRFKHPTSILTTRSASSEDTEGKSINHNIYVPIQPAD